MGLYAIIAAQGTSSAAAAVATAAATAAADVAAPVLGVLAFTYGSDADATLSAPQAANGICKVSGAVISATRKLICPLTAGATLILDNQEGHSVTVIGATGTGITVATTKSALLWCDGTNWNRVTPDT